MKCEACGGDGLIEYGAYRGADDTDTRECRLCGGPNVHDECDTGAISFKDEKGVMRIQHTIAATGFSAEQAGRALGQLAQKVGYPAGAGERFQMTGNRLQLMSSENGVREKVAELSTGPQSWNPEDVAREYARRLNAENERQQREAETPNVVMNRLLRSKL